MINICKAMFYRIIKSRVTLYCFILSIAFPFLLVLSSTTSATYVDIKGILDSVSIMGLAVIFVFISIFIFTLVLLLIFFEIFNILDYEIIGILIVICFYFFKSKLKFLFSSILIILLSLKLIFLYGLTPFNICINFALFSIIILLFYNGKKGKLNLKYLFYIFYPAHLMIIWILTHIII